MFLQPSDPAGPATRRARRPRRSIDPAADGSADDLRHARRFERILVPLDLTAKSEAALEKAAALARAALDDRSGGAAVWLVHVIETIRDVEFAELRDFYEPLERRAQARLEHHAATLANQGIDVEVVIRYGNRVREIVATAREVNADLVLLGSHRIEHHGPSAGGLATISYQVAALAPCSVLLLKPSGTPESGGPA